MEKTCKRRSKRHKQEPNADVNEPRFLQSTKLHQAIRFKESSVRIVIARKRHPNKQSKKNLDDRYEVLAPGSVVQKTDHYTSVIREPGKLDITVRISDFARFVTRGERKTKLHVYINRRGPRILKKSTEVKILSHTKSLREYKKATVK